MSPRIALIVLISAIIVGATGAAAQNRAQYTYTALTAAPALRQGTVVAAGVTWSCQGQTCQTRGPWPRPLMVGCRALVAQVGAITSYGREGAAFDAVRIATCNRLGAPAAQTSAPPADTPPAEPSTPAATPPAEPSPPPVITPATAPGDQPFTINTPEVVFIGGATVDTSDRNAGAVEITTPEIAFVGGAVVDTSDRLAPPVTITTPEITFVGQ